jgi:hypothetical protein
MARATVLRIMRPTSSMSVELTMYRDEYKS